MRFIPTAVGNAASVDLVELIRPVHPHGCGERAARDYILCPRIGSSPRLWGTRPAWLAVRPAGRFIPTAVGNAFCVGVGVAFYAVHPHGCGERETENDHSNEHSGSSPRLWGTPEYEYGIAFIIRFIPTAVGNAW